MRCSSRISTDASKLLVDTAKVPSTPVEQEFRTYSRHRWGKTLIAVGSQKALFILYLPGEGYSGAFSSTDLVAQPPYHPCNLSKSHASCTPAPTSTAREERSKCDGKTKTRARVIYLVASNGRDRGNTTTGQAATSRGPFEKEER